MTRSTQFLMYEFRDAEIVDRIFEPRLKTEFTV